MLRNGTNDLAQMEFPPLCKSKVEGEVVGSRSTGCVCNYQQKKKNEVLRIGSNIQYPTYYS